MPTALAPPLFLFDLGNPNGTGLYGSLYSEQQISSGTMFRGDRRTILVGLVQRAQPGTVTGGRIWDFVDPTGAAVAFGIGALDQTPTAGTFAGSYNGSSTGLTTLAYNISAAALITALNANSAVTSAGGISSVTLLDTGLYEIRFATVGTKFLFAWDGTNLTPQSAATGSRIVTGDATHIEVQTLQLAQRPYAYNDTWTAAPAASATISQTQTGSATATSIQRITLDVVPFDGTFVVSLDLDGVTVSASIPFNATGQQFTQQLSTASPDQIPVFNVTKVPPLGWDIAYLAVGSRPAMTSDVSGLKVPLTLEGTINLATEQMAAAFGALDTLDALMEMQYTPAGGDSWTPYQGPETIKKDLLDFSTLLPNPSVDYLTLAEADARYSRVATRDTGKIVYVDSVFGDDATGLRQRLDRPFLGLEAARDAAFSGYTIIVRPGVYTCSSPLAKTGVNWDFAAGATVTRTLSGVAPAGGIWDDLGSAIICKVTGYGVFTLTGSTTDNTTDTGPVHLSHASSDMEIHCLSLLETCDYDNFNCSAVRQTDGTLRLHTGRIYTQEHQGIWWDKGPAWITVDGEIDGGTVEGQGIYVSAASSPTGALWVLAKKIIGNPAMQISGEATAQVWIECSEVIGPVSTVQVSGCKFYLTTQKISTTTGGNYAIAISGGLAWITTQKISGQAILMSGGTLFADVQQFEDPSLATGPMIQIGADSTLDLRFHRLQTASTAYNAVEVSSSTATVSLRGGTIDASSGTSANPITKSGGVLKLYGVTLVAQVGRDSISAATAQNVVALGAWANKAVDSDVTITTAGGLTIDADVI